MKKLISIILSLLTVISLIPFTYVPVSAAETCTCATKCTEGSVNSECAVCFANGGEPGTCTGGYTYDEATNTYTVYTADGLFAVAELVNGGEYSINITLAADIVLNENLADKVTVAEDGTLTVDASVRTWTPMGAIGSGEYQGTFDGGNHTITGLYCVPTGYGNSLIGTLVEGATVKNVKIHDFCLENGGGAVVGSNRGEVSGCSISGTGILGGQGSSNLWCGGIVSYNAGTVENCSSSADLYFKGAGNFGGIVGYADYGSSVTGCYSSGALEAEAVSNLYVGGIVGNAYGDITDCHNSGSVYVKNTASDSGMYVEVGGIAGESSGNITGCSNSGSVEVVHDSILRFQTYVGGIVGQLIDASVTGCYNTGSLKAENRSEDTVTMYACGIGFSNYSTVTGCYNTGSVESDKASSAIRRGGGTVTDCYYLDGCVKSGETVDSEIDGITAKTEAQFASGEVAYLLNGDQSTITFKQTLGTDAAPNFTGGTVYQVENCKGEPVYSNTNENIGHNFVGAETAKPTCYAVGKMTYTCDVCSDSYEEEIKAYHDGNLEYHAAKDPVDCATPGNVEHWYCPGCDGYFEDANAEVSINPVYIEITVDCERPEGAADCATLICGICGREIYGNGEHDVVACQGGVCGKCGEEIEGFGCLNYDTPACEDGLCYYCGGFVAGLGHENGAWAPCIDSECAYGCGLLYPATEDHIDEDNDNCCDICWGCANHVAPDSDDPCDGYNCENCGEWIEGQHTGGKATCTTQAVCEACGASYGELADHNWENGKCTYGCNTQHDPHDWENGTCTLCGLVCGHSGGTTKPTDNGNGTHSFTCAVCGDATEGHSFDENGTCVCGVNLFTVSDSTLTIDGTLGGKTEATEEDLTALVAALKSYVESGHTTIIVTGSQPAKLLKDGYLTPVVSLAFEQLTYDYQDEKIDSYWGTVDLIYQDVTEIVEYEFYVCDVLKSITLPKVTTVGDSGFWACYYLETLTFGSVVTAINDNSGEVFYDLGYEIDGCNLALNCGQVKAETDYQPNIETKTWWKDNEWKSITLTHSYGDWISNGDGTHKRTCANDSTHTENGDCSGGTATCTTPAVCDTCGESYGELDPDNHEYEKNNGICCGTYQSATLNADGYYEIFNAGQLFWFANYINTVDRTASAVLTADIDLENRPWTPIGSTGENSNNFRGVFDGQNHTIKGLYVEGGRAGLGFFGEVRTGTVKNFKIYGKVVVNTEVNYVGGVIGSICGLNSSDHGLERNGAVIQNITSYVNLTAKAHGIGMIGGFVGYANHQSLIENCSWYGTFDAGIYRVDSGAGGFIGKIQENTSEVTIRNCAAYGTIKTGYAGDYNNTATIYMGGFLSFSNTNAQTTLENCLFAGKFERGENLTDKAFLGAFGTLRSVNAIKNCYYLGDDGLEAVHSDSNLKPGSDNVEITSVTGEQLKSGEVAYLLGSPFGQNIYTEFAPVLNGEMVYEVHNCKNEVTYSNTNENLDHNYVNGVCTVCGAADPDYSVPEYSLGDIDGDGTINGKDINVLKQIISGAFIPSATQELASDVNGDGNVNGVDANLIAQLLAGNIGGF